MPTFLELLPRSHERELKLKLAMGMTNYSELTAQVMGYSQQIRFRARTRGETTTTQPWTSAPWRLGRTG